MEKMGKTAQRETDASPPLPLLIKVAQKKRWQRAAHGWQASLEYWQVPSPLGYFYRGIRQSQGSPELGGLHAWPAV